jgi:hypothetical protein
MRFCGIDPGKKGAIAILDERGQVLELLPTPMILVERQGKSDREDYDVPAIAAFFRARADSSRTDRGLFVVVERLHPLPAKFKRKGGVERAGGGVVANFNRGLAQGWPWMLQAFRIPHVLILPQVWQRALMEGLMVNVEPKERSVAMAKKLWPWTSLKRTPRARTDDDGLAEALLLAEYARRTYQGGDVFAAATRA